MFELSFAVAAPGESAQVLVQLAAASPVVQSTSAEDRRIGRSQSLADASRQGNAASDPFVGAQASKVTEQALVTHANRQALDFASKTEGRCFS